MGIKLLDVTVLNEQELIAEINKIIWILIERYNDEVGMGWDCDKTYTNNRALDEDEGDDYSLVNDVVVSYSNEEMSETEDSSKWSNTWEFTSDNDGFTIKHTLITEGDDDVSNSTEVWGDFEVAYWWAHGAYEQKWIPTDKN